MVNLVTILFLSVNPVDIPSLEVAKKSNKIIDKLQSNSGKRS